MGINIKKMGTHSRHFILNVGDSGAILSYFHEGALQFRQYAPSTDADAIQDFIENLTVMPQVPISILVDVSDQTYTEQVLPGVDMFSINKLVKNRINRDFSPEDINGAIKLGRSDTGRKDWHYLFITLHMVAPFSDWLGFMEKIPNPCLGVYLLPLESSHLVNRFVQYTTKEYKCDVPKWKILILHSKIGGFRQIVVRDDNIVFTRMIANTRDVVPDIIAGNIEQEILNTIEYLRRLGLKDDEKLHVYLVSSSDINQSIDNMKIPAEYVIPLSPYEVTERLGIHCSVGKQDKFSDTLVASIFANNKPFKEFTTKTIGKVKAKRMLKVASIGAIVVTAIALLGLNIANVYDIKETSAEIDVLTDKRNILRQELKSIQSSFKLDDSNISIDEVNRISDVAMIHKSITQKSVDPLLLMSYMGYLLDYNISINSVEWKMEDEVQEKKSRSKRSKRNRKRGKNANSKNDKFAMRVDFVIYNNHGSYDELLSSYYKLTSSLDKTFKGYDVSYPEFNSLQNNISTSRAKKAIGFQVLIGSKES